MLGGPSKCKYRLSNGPYGASHGLLLGLIGDTKWTYQVNWSSK